MRPDLDIVAGMVGRGASVLDLGCGDGVLLEHLIERQECQGLGVEIDEDGFHGCIARGVPVTHGDLEQELPQIDDGAFDVAVLSLTLQSVSRPDVVLDEMSRVAGLIIVSLPNLGYWRRRARLGFRGRVPLTGDPNEKWYDSEKIHACTIADFEDLAQLLGLRTSRRVVIDGQGRKAPRVKSGMANLLAEGAVYLLER